MKSFHQHMCHISYAMKRQQVAVCSVGFELGGACTSMRLFGIRPELAM